MPQSAGSLGLKILKAKVEISFKKSRSQSINQSVYSHTSGMFTIIESLELISNEF